MNREIGTVADRLSEALAIGRRMRAIRQNFGLWSLSRASWLRQTAELAGWHLDDVVAARDRLAIFPYLTAELRIRARLWADGGQDRPAVWRCDGARFPAAYSELLASNLSAAQVSAVACLMTAEMRDAAGFVWGDADSLEPADGDLALQPHLDELATIDRELARMVLASMLTYRSGGAFLEHAGLEIEINAGSVRVIASTLAERAGLTVAPVAVAA